MVNSFGGAIRQLREKKDLSLREFAKQLDTSAAHVSDIELGRRFPSEALMVKMASLLGVKVAELRRFDHRPPVEDIKRLSEADPAYGFAFRKLVEKDITAAEIFAMIKKNRKGDDR